MTANEEHLEHEYSEFIKKIDIIIKYLEQGDNKFIKKSIVLDMLYRAKE